MKTFLKKITLQIGQKMSEEVFKNTVPWTYLISDLNCREIFEMFCEKELQKTNQKEFRV